MNVFACIITCANFVDDLASGASDPEALIRDLTILDGHMFFATREAAMKKGFLILDHRRQIDADVESEIQMVELDDGEWVRRAAGKSGEIIDRARIIEVEIEPDPISG